MAKITVVTKDVAEFKLYHRVVGLLRSAGHEVIVVAEGLSLDKWVETREKVFLGKPDPTEVDSLGRRRDILLPAFFDLFQPDLVLTGLGHPINLGQSFGLEANRRGIKLGYVLDVWGAESRSRAIPDFICTLDEFSRKQIESYEHYQSKRPKVYITGSPLLDSLVEVEEISQPFGELWMSYPVILFVGQDESTTPALSGSVEALNECFGDGYVLIPRFHPKFKGKEEWVKWQEILSTATGNVLFLSPIVSIQEIMRLAECTVSIYSNALVEAAALGSLPVSWVSDIGRQKMSEAMGGLTRFPLVTQGCAVEVSLTQHFVDLLRAPNEEKKKFVNRCQFCYQGNGGNAQKVVQAVISELG